MGDDRIPIRTYIVPDEDQPISDVDRAIVEGAFEILERMTGAELLLIILRAPDGSIAIQEPHHPTPDMDRALGELRRVVAYLEGR